MRSHDPLIDRLATEATERVSWALRGARRVAFVNFPNHGNAGDPALWLGGMRVLDRIGARVVYHCEHRTYQPQMLAESRPESIVINGGGNLGDVWPGQQQCRERVLADFPQVPTVQLPQSLRFRDPTNLARMQRLIADHDDVTLLLRDPISLAAAQRWFDAPSQRCPDLAFALGSQRRAARPRHQVLWLARDDQESAGHRPDTAGLDAAVLDWLQEVPDEPAWSRRESRALRRNRDLTRRVRDDASAARRWNRALSATYRPIARARTRRGMAILARGEVVITDRLHGHVLSLLQGIPHVVMDNADGKVRALYDADTHASSLAHWADSPNEAVAIARSLLGEVAPTRAGTGTPLSPGA